MPDMHRYICEALSSGVDWTPPSKVSEMISLSSEVRGSTFASWLITEIDQVAGADDWKQLVNWNHNGWIAETIIAVGTQSTELK